MRKLRNMAAVDQPALSEEEEEEVGEMVIEEVNHSQLYPRRSGPVRGGRQTGVPPVLGWWSQTG